MGGDRGKGRGKRSADGGQGGRGKRAKPYVAQGASLPLNTRGFLVSCPNGKEWPASHEAMQLIQEYYERLLPKGEQAPVEAEAGGAQDISAQLAAEVAQLQDPQQKVFAHHKVGIAGLVYITMAPNAPGPGPAEVLLAAAEDIARTRQCRSRLCMRFTPVEHVGYAALNEMRRAAERVVAPRFAAADPPLRFSVQFDHRASAKLDRLEVINAVIKGIQQPPHKVDLNDPQLTVVVQVLRNVCAMGVAPRFREMCKYNLRELCIPPEEREAERAAEKARAAERAAEKAAAAGQAAGEGAAPAAGEAAAAPAAMEGGAQPAAGEAAEHAAGEAGAPAAEGAGEQAAEAGRAAAAAAAAAQGPPAEQPGGKPEAA